MSENQNPDPRSLEAKYDLTPEQAEARRKKAASIRARRSQAHKRARETYPEGSDLLEHELAKIDRRLDAEAAELGLRQPRIKVRETKAARRRKPTGDGIRCCYVVHDRADGAFDLDVYEATTTSGTGYGLNPYRLPKLTAAQLEKEVEALTTDGFDPARYSRPLKDYVAEAHRLRQRQLAGDFDLDEENPAAYEKARIAIREVNRSATIGLFLGLLILARGHEDEVLRKGRGGQGGLYFRIYDAVGDARVPMAEGAFHASVDHWIGLIANETLKGAPSTGVGRPGKDAASKKVVKDRLKCLRDAFRTAATVGACFPSARSADGILTRVRIKRVVEELGSKGMTRNRIPFRSLYRREIEIVLEQAPSLAHVAFFVFCLSTGLRPQHANMLSTRFYDPSTGALSFEKGMLYEINPGGEKKRISRGRETVVVRLILSFPEVFEIGRMPELVAYLKRIMKKNPDLKAFAKEKGVRAACQKDLRTTCAKNLFVGGWDFADIALRLGNTVDVASKHYADNVPPDATHFERGPAFFGDLGAFRVEGESVCLKGNPWDGWLLRAFLRECRLRKLQEYGDDKQGFADFMGRLAEKVLTAYRFEETQMGAVLESAKTLESFTSLDAF